jgi:hypothetical protein
LRSSFCVFSGASPIPSLQALLLVIDAHVAAAMAHTFIFRDRIMKRMLPEKPMALTKIQKPEVARMKPAQESRVS